MLKKVFICFVALLAIAAMATGPARAQSNTVRWQKYQISVLNLMQGDRETIDDVTITCNDGSAINDGGDIKFNGEFTFSVSPGSVLTQIVIKDETWLNVTGWSRDDSETEATWTGSARSVACVITTSNAQYIEFTIASAVPKMYTSEVSITDLVPGDTLAEGATIIGSGSEDDMVFLGAGRTKENGVVPQYWTNLFLPPTVIGTNGTISKTNNTYTPVDGNGQDGNAWVVTSAEINDYNGFEVGLSGIRIPGPPHTVRMAEGTVEAANWSLASGNASVPGTQVLENVMSGSELTATYNGTKKVKSVKAVKYVAPPTLLDNTTTTWADGRYAVPEGGLTYSDAITVSGNVTLTLTDGTTLTLNKGISLASGATLTVEGNGTMNVNGTNESTASTVAGTGTLVLTSGTLTAKGGNGGSVDNVEAGLHGGNGGDAINGSVIVSGGTLTATGGNGGNVGDQGTNNNGGAGGAAIIGSVTVNSGTLTATGGNGGSVGNYGYNCGGGAGSAAISGDLTINSGTVTSTNGANGQLGQYTDDCSAGAGGKAVAGTVIDNR